jgi:hypothetical protein
MLPLPMVMGTAPATPMRNRKAMSMPMPLLRAAPTVKRVKRTLPKLYRCRRPYSSLRGAISRGPKAKPRM